MPPEQRRSGGAHAVAANSRVSFSSRPSCARRFGNAVKSYLDLTVSLLYWTIVAPWRGEFLNVSHVFQQIVRIGVRSLPMVALTAFTVGLALAIEAANSLRRMGAQTYVPD